MSQDYKITLRDSNGNTKEIGTQNGQFIDSLSVVREHSTISDFEAPIRTQDYKTIEEDWIGPTTDVFIEINNELIFRGYASRLEGDESTGEAILGGPDIFAKLRRENRVDYQPDDPPSTAANAISDLWNKTPFKGGASVDFPSAPQVASGEFYDVTGDDDGNVREANEWANNTRAFKESNAPDTAAIYIDTNNDELTMHQHSWSDEAENPKVGGENVPNDVSALSTGPGASFYSNGEAIRIDRDGNTSAGRSVTFNAFNPDYTIPEGEFDFAIRSVSDASIGALEVKLLRDVNGTTRQIGEDGYIGSDDTLSWNELNVDFGGVEIEKGVDHFIQLFALDPSDVDTKYDIDAIQPHDDRFTFNYDNDNGGSDGYLDTPALYSTTGDVDTPMGVEVSEYQSPYPVDITDGDGLIDWVNSSGPGFGAEFEVSNDGRRNYINVKTGTSPSFQFLTTSGTSLAPRLTLSGQGARFSAFPQTGFQRGGVDTMNLTYNGDDRPVIHDEKFSGNLLDIQKELHERAGMRFVARYDKNNLKVSSFPKGKTETANYTTKNRERVLDTDGYANAVTAAGRTVNGETIKATVESEKLQNNPVERIEWFVKDPNLTTKAGVKALAREELEERLSKAALSGTIEIVPTNVQPGYQYSVNTFGDPYGAGPYGDGAYNGAYLNLERVEYRERAGVAEGILEFQLAPKLEEKTTGNTSSIGTVRRSL